MKKVFKIVVNSDNKESISKFDRKLGGFLSEFAKENKTNHVYTIMEETKVSQYDEFIYDIVNGLEDKGWAESSAFIEELIYSLVELPETQMIVDKKLDMMNIIFSLCDAVPESIRSIFSESSESAVSEYWNALISVLTEMKIKKRVFHNTTDSFGHESICLTIKHA